MGSGPIYSECSLSMVGRHPNCALVTDACERRSRAFFSAAKRGR
jgi:hypothetical protein